MKKGSLSRDTNIVSPKCALVNIVPALANKICNFFQIDEALAVDSLHLISHALNILVTKKPELLKDNLNGTLLKNATERLDCESEPTTPWTYGPDVMTIMKKVSLQLP